MTCHTMFVWCLALTSLPSRDAIFANLAGTRAAGSAFGGKGGSATASVMMEKSVTSRSAWFGSGLLDHHTSTMILLVSFDREIRTEFAAQ